MKKLFSTACSETAFNIGTFLLRVGAGVLMIPGGYNKLMNFSTMKPMMINFLGLGQDVSLGLLIFAEFFCAGLVIIGLLTRLATIPLIIAMVVALKEGHKWNVFGDGQLPSFFIVAFITILILGPGKYSVDGLIRK